MNGYVTLMPVLRESRTDNEPTRRVEQDHVVSCVDAALLRQRCCNLLGPLVQLHTRGCAHCHPLQDRMCGRRQTRGRGEVKQLLTSIVSMWEFCIFEHAL